MSPSSSTSKSAVHGLAHVVNPLALSCHHHEVIQIYVAVAIHVQHVEVILVHVTVVINIQVRGRRTLASAHLEVLHGHLTVAILIHAALHHLLVIILVYVAVAIEIHGLAHFAHHAALFSHQHEV